MSSAKSRPFCPGLNVLTEKYTLYLVPTGESCAASCEFPSEKSTRDIAIAQYRVE